MTSVLFVSPDDDLRAVVTRVLRRAGYHVRAVAHGGHALIACVERGSFDVLVIEESLPEGAGIAIAARLRRHCPRMEVVRLCDCGAATAARAGIAVVRPFTADDLIDAVYTRRRTTSR